MRNGLIFNEGMGGGEGGGEVPNVGTSLMEEKDHAKGV